MTKYRLKDQELQKHLDAISGGDFSIRFNKFRPISIQKDTAIYFVFGSMQREGFADGFGNFRRFQICLLGDELEAQPEYNPDDWNKFPEVTPPDSVLMRVETRDGRKFCGFYHTFAEGGCWCYEDGTVCPEAISKSVKRYRTWE